MPKNISRRSLLRYGVSIGCVAMAPLGTTTTASAQDPATIAAATLAVASFVGGLIASANRRNVDSIMLQAVLQELKVIQEQLASLQNAMAIVMVKLAELPKEIAEVVAKQSVRDLHRDLMA